MGAQSVVPATGAEATAVSHADRLAMHGALLDVWLSRSGALPPRWLTPYFARVVDLVRAHLHPICTRELLAMSYSREQFHVVAIGRPLEAPKLLSRDATEVAYALRWLELGSARRSASWSSLIGDH